MEEVDEGRARVEVEAADQQATPVDAAELRVVR